jgi:hypothetical protein
MRTGRLLLAACLSLAPATATAQLSVTVQGGIHAARLDRPERELIQPGRDLFVEGARGEATTFGLRAGTWWSPRLGMDAGVAWSRNTSWEGGFAGTMPPDFETNTIFTSATLRARLTRPGAAVGLVAGAGPAMVVHAGSGTSLLSRTTDFGGLVTLGGSLRMTEEFSLTTDVQQYFFSSRFSSSYVDVSTGAIRPAGSQGRHEFVILAGLKWERIN